MCLAAAAAVVLGLSAPAAQADQYLSRQTFYQWDSSSRLKMKIWPASTDGGLRRAEQYAYTVDGWLDTVVIGTVTNESGANFIAQETRSFTYDAVGNTVRATTPSGVTQFSYDGADHLICAAVRMTAALAADACAPVTTGTDNPDRITKSVYDAAGQVTTAIQALGSGIERTYASYGYSKNGRQTSITDAVGNRTDLRYDGFDRLARQSFPQKTRGANAASTDDYETYEYDKAGNRTALNKRDGSRIEYTYDAANQLKTKAGARVRSVTYDYDLTGKAASVIFTGTSDGVYYGYDTAGRLDSETSQGPVGQTSYSRKLTFGFDAAGSRTSIAWPAGGGSATYTYDLAGLPDKVNDDGFELADYGYDALSRRTEVKFGNGTRQTQTWDGASRPDERDLFLANSDHNDHRKFYYNAADQLTSETHAAVYDYTGYAAALGPVADGLNRDAALALVAGYDANQNLISDKGHTFTYDGENRLLTASWPSGAVLDYDPLGRLRQTTINGTVTQFLYDGDQLVAEYDGAGNLLRRYVHGAGVDDPLVWYEGGARRWLHADRQGSIIAWSDASGISQSTYTYGPYGEPGDNWAAGSRFRYTGQIALPELKVYHYKARVYDPMRGWFLQTDPIGYGDNLNLYAYADADPINNSDPTGLLTKEQIAFQAYQKAHEGQYARGFFTIVGAPAAAGVAIGGCVVACPAGAAAVGGWALTRIPFTFLNSATAVGAEFLAPGAGIGAGYGLLASNANKGPALTRQLLAEEVASGHAMYHVNRGEFAAFGVTTKFQLQNFVEKLLGKKGLDIRYSTDGAKFILDSTTKTVVTYGRGEATAFRPDVGGMGWDKYLKTLPTRNTPY
ncbi:hypothetical protein ASD79_22350 [Caulobacter sp. Root655]|nr:hypothetical protein ASD79_22350 [Caulobacter sp. Root655]